MPSPSRKKSNSEILIDTIRSLVPSVAYEIWDVNKVAEFFGEVGREEIYRLVHDEGLPYIDMGGKGYRFLSMAVVMWVIVHQAVDA